MSGSVRDSCGRPELRPSNWCPRGNATTVLVFPWWPLAPNYKCCNPIQLQRTSGIRNWLASEPQRTSYWLRLPAIANPLMSVLRMSGLAVSKSWKISGSVKVLYSFWNTHSASRVQSHLAELSNFLPHDDSDFLSHSVSGRVTLTYFRINLQ